MTKHVQTANIMNDLELGRIAGGYANVIKHFSREYPVEASPKTFTKIFHRKTGLERKRRMPKVVVFKAKREPEGVLCSPVSHIEEAFPSTRRIKEMFPYEEQKRVNNLALMKAIERIENQSDHKDFEDAVARARKKLDEQIASESTDT